MSLNSEQRAATIREFQENMSRLGLTAERIGKDFGVSGSRVEQIITPDIATTITRRRQRQQSGANHHPQVGRAGVSVDYPSLSAEQI